MMRGAGGGRTPPAFLKAGFAPAPAPGAGFAGAAPGTAAAGGFVIGRILLLKGAGPAGRAWPAAGAPGAPGGRDAGGRGAWPAAAFPAPLIPPGLFKAPRGGPPSFGPPSFGPPSFGPPILPPPNCGRAGRAASLRFCSSSAVLVVKISLGILRPLCSNFSIKEGMIPEA